MDEEAEQRAVEWFVRMGSPNVTRADRRAYAEWLIADQAHRQAYDEVAKAWTDVGELDGWARETLSDMNLLTTKTRRRTGRWIAGLVAAAAVVASIALWPMLSESAVQHFETAKAEQRHVLLADGSRVHLNTASEVKVEFDAAARHIELARGEGLFDVEHDGARPFVVEVGRHRVIAVGTRFAVRRFENGAMDVTVLEGRVAVVQRASQSARRATPVATTSDSLIIEPNQRAHVAATGERTLAPVSATAETAWLEGKLVFDGAPLRAVVEEISRYVPGEIRVADDVPDDPVTGVIKIRNSDAMLDLLSQVVPVTPVRQSATVTVLHVRS